MNDNIDIDRTIAGSMNDSIYMDSTIAGSLNDNINIDNSECFGVTFVKIYPEMAS
jgi:hypothetical protein